MIRIATAHHRHCQLVHHILRQERKRVITKGKLVLYDNSECEIFGPIIVNKEFDKVCLQYFCKLINLAKML